MDAFSQLGQTPILGPIKSLFVAEVSPRRLAYIETLAQLLCVLKSQNLLNRSNIDHLKQHLPIHCDGFVEERLLQLRQAVGDNAQRNVYADLYNAEAGFDRCARQPFHNVIINSPAAVVQSHSSPNLPSPSNASSVPSTTNPFDSVRPAVYRLIAEEIGKRWRDLGRELRVSEGRLDEINETHRNSTANKVHAVFAQFEERTPRRQQCQMLLDALEQVPRRDLRRQVQTMLLCS